MRTLIFEPILSGHHLEYLHHYYMGALSLHEESYIIKVPRKFIEVKSKYEWPKSTNIRFDFFSHNEEIALKETNVYKLGWKASKILNYTVRKVKADKVILTTIMQFIPFIIFLLPRNVLVRGIMYKVYLYEANNMPFLRLLLEMLRFKIATCSNIIEKIFVLNDLDSVRQLNNFYKTDKFCFLPDPIPKIDLANVRDVRRELNIPESNKIYLHFGALNQRKGTLDILESIITSTKQEMEGKTFIFAGKQNLDFRELFYPLLEKAKCNANILVFDEFCSYEFLNNLCFTCDVILMPYHITNLSSGVLGYAAFFKKTVIGPNSGLIGNLIEKFKLGITINIPIQKEDLSIDNNYEKFGAKKYVESNNVSLFTEIIME